MLDAATGDDALFGDHWIAGDGATTGGGDRHLCPGGAGTDAAELCELAIAVP